MVFLSACRSGSLAGDGRILESRHGLSSARRHNRSPGVTSRPMRRTSWRTAGPGGGQVDALGAGAPNCQVCHQDRYSMVAGLWTPCIATVVMGWPRTCRNTRGLPRFLFSDSLGQFGRQAPPRSASQAFTLGMALSRLEADRAKTRFAIGRCAGAPMASGRAQQRRAVIDQEWRGPTERIRKPERDRRPCARPRHRPCPCAVESVRRKDMRHKNRNCALPVISVHRRGTDMTGRACKYKSSPEIRISESNRSFTLICSWARWVRSIHPDRRRVWGLRSAVVP